MTATHEIVANPPARRVPRWMKSPWLARLGKFAFLFFFIKGLVWLGVFGAGAWAAYRAAQ
ncbi:MAG TPA: hypothetical protein VK176_08800 [Phycisphaerales bacterium]|nr:hypothetical protein [Phycisphaerales bacterium]